MMQYTSNKNQTVYTLPNIKQTSQYTDLKVSTKYDLNGGIPGRAATIQIGNVTTGSHTSITNVGTDTDAIFDFVLEQGPQGPVGPRGEVGPAGPGVPSGGTAGQYLVKSSSTDYDTEWITPPYDLNKEHGSKVIIRLTNESSHIDSTTVRIQFGQTESSGQMIDWGDGTAPEEMTSIMEHTFPDYGFYELTIYGKVWFDHYLYIDEIYGWNPETQGKIENSHATIREAKVSYYCMGVSLDVKSSTFEGCDLSAWTSQTISYGRTLGKFSTYLTMTGTLELPWAGVYDCHIDYAPQLESIIFPGCTSYNSRYTWQDVFKEPTGSSASIAFHLLKRIELKAVVPPLIHTTEYEFWLPNVPIIVPWSPDHSILAAYKAATGWSTYASQITEETNVPAGGTQGQILAKSSSTDYDTEWIDAPSGGDVIHDVILKINTPSIQPLTFRGNAETIDWGDGTVTSPAVRGTVHQYAEGGGYTITIDGITDWGDSSQSGINRSIFSCDVILEVEINTTSIGDDAFRECRSLYSVKAPNVQELGTGTFYNCSGLTGDINKMIPTWNLTRIKSWCFYETGFTGIFDASHIIFKKENGSPDQFQYAFPRRIYSIKLPELAVSLQLKGIDYLENLVIPDGTRVICDIVSVSSNSTMYYARIPGSVQSIRGSIFTQFYALKSIYIEDGAFSDFNDWNSTNNTESYNELTSNFDSGTSSICRYCNHLEKVRLPEGMKALGKIGNVSSSTASSFSDGIFTEFNIPSTVTQIWNICQSCTNLTTLTFPAGLEKIAANSFTGCTSLATLHMKGTTPPELTANCFTNCPLTAIYVPASAVSDYQNHTDWARFSSIIQAEPTT